MWIILLWAFSILALAILYHNYMLHLEKEKIRPNGIIVKVDGFDYHVYSEGEKNDKPTIVVLPGSSMPSPVYNYKKLYSRFADEYRVAVPEKFGYGYSSINDSPRDVDTILEQTRQALALAGEKPPYILMPHSMSGIEAQMWAHKYPQEVSGIIGLDMALTRHYEGMNLGSRQTVYKISTHILRAIGLQRLPLFCTLCGVNDKDSLTKEEWTQEKYLIARNALNKMIVAESTKILDSALKVKALGPLHIPMLLFVSDGKVLKNWLEEYQVFLTTESNAKLVQLDCGHMMHNTHAAQITTQSKEWIESTLL